MRKYFGKNHIQIYQTKNTETQENNWCVQIEEGGGLISEMRGKMLEEKEKEERKAKAEGKGKEK